jgi:predicted HTH transcriptional regulator
MPDAKTKRLLAKIDMGEDSVLELKTAVFAGGRMTAPHRDSIADELAAFANSKGGVFVIGVDDKTRRILSLDHAQLDVVEEVVRGVCNDAIAPPLQAHIEKLRVPTGAGRYGHVVKVEVPGSLFVHRSPGGYLWRIGSSKRRVTPEQLARLFQQRSQTRIVRFDEGIVREAKLADLDAPLWRRFRTVRTRDPRDELLGKLGMARRDDSGRWHPTVTGVLMATAEPRRWIPNAFIQAVAYKGAGTVPENPREPYQIDAKDISGPLDQQAIEVCRFVYRNMRMGATKTLGRGDRPQFDMSGVLEAAVNAVAHRDYSIQVSKIRLRLFEDRFELYSPGALANTLDIESLPYRQAARNEAICSLLARCPVPDMEWLSTDRRALMDRRGEGVRIILDRSEAISGRRPEYRLLDDAELVLTVFAAGHDVQRPRLRAARPRRPGQK